MNPFCLAGVMTASQLIAESLLKKKAKKKLLKGVPFAKKVKFAEIRSGVSISEIYTKISNLGLKAFSAYIVRLNM
jgi:hypothetical protein